MAFRHRGVFVSVDAPVPGVAIHQPERGFRYGAESFWIAGFAIEGGVPPRVLDLGTGSGIIAALFAARGCAAVGVDARAEWKEYWAETLQRSSLRGTLRLEHRDVVDLPVADFDVVVSNPPFFAAGTGPVAPDPWKAAARTESTATLADFVAASVRSLRAGGRSCWVIPVERRGDLLRAGARWGWAPSRCVVVGARRILVELRADAEPVVERSIAESDPVVEAWYGSVGARNRR
jgi:tRNA1(Val) A37 N6-methylase TrmN6